MRAFEFIDNELYRRILDKKDRLDAYGRLSPDDIKKIESKMQIEYVYNSNSIEGITLTRGETELAFKGMTVRNHSLTEVLAAQNHPDTIQIIKEMAFDAFHRITEEDIRNIHLMIMDGIIGSAGKYREYDLSVRGAKFTPPSFHEIPEHMNELIEFLNENPDGLRPVELAAYAHYHIAWIHPFEDGNGRVSRLVLNFILLRYHYPVTVIQRVERNKYIDTLSLADNGDFKPYLNFICRSVEQTLDLYLFALDEKNGKSDDKVLLPIRQLRESTPYTLDHLGFLARKGHIDAVKQKGEWYTTKKNVTNYIQQHLNEHRGKANRRRIFS